MSNTKSETSAVQAVRVRDDDVVVNDFHETDPEVLAVVREADDADARAAQRSLAELGGLLVLIGALALAVLLPVQASAATTFGTDLSRVPDDRMVDCTTFPPWGVPTYQDTCTWYSTISNSENDIVPEGVGVISRARVRVGSFTGLMQFAVGRAQVDRNKPIGQQLLCCVWRPTGPPFTPAANSITEVTLNEPVLHVRDFEANQDLFDNLALSVLQPGVPIPATPTLSGFGSTSTAGACWPAVQLGNTYCMPGGPGNYAVLFNADWTLLPIGGGAGAILDLVSQSAKVRKNAALVPLICRLSQECAGLLRLQNAKAPGALRLQNTKAAGAATAAARRTVTYGSIRIRIPAGKTKTVKVKLGKAGRNLMHKHKTARVWANSTVGRGTARQVVSARLTLKR